MNNLSSKLGFWSTVVCLVTFIIWIVCFIGILAVNPLFIWTNLSDFVAYTKENNQLFKHLAELAMLIFGIAFLVLLSSIKEYAPDNKKILANISVYFGIIFSGLISINYFVQLSAVRISLLRGEITGLEQFIQSNPISGMAAINILGWSIFFGFSSIFIAPIFSGNKLEKIISYSFGANGVICILGGIGYIFNIVILVFLCMNLGMGLASLTALISLIIWFKRKN